MKRLRWTFFLFAATASACSLFTSLDGLSGGAEPPSTGDATGDAPVVGVDSAVPPEQAGGVDAGPDAEAAGPRGPNFLPTGDFELASSCAGQGYESSWTLDPIAHSGAHSCRVCYAYGQPPNVYSYDQTLSSVGTPPVGFRYHAEAWVRTAPDAAAPSQGAQITLRDFTTAGGGFNVFDNQHSGYAALGSDWTKVSVELTIALQTEGLDVYVDAPLDQTETCFLVDDVVVQRVY